MPSSTDIVVNQLDGHDLKVRPAGHQRAWMDATPQAYAYRCLPVTIANSSGWEILCSQTVTVLWNGGADKSDLSVTCSDKHSPCAVSHFGSGIVTFYIPALIQTKPGVSLFLTGPINQPKHGIQGLSGVIETDWSEHSFTMNWKVTSLHAPIRFEVGEPIAHFFPIKLGELSQVQIAKRPLANDPELAARHARSLKDREDFLTAGATQPPTTTADQWQKHYFRGRQSDGEKGQGAHYTKLRLSEVEDID